MYITYTLQYLYKIIPANSSGDERLDTYKINQLQYTIRRVR
jgi:hypothetical protein